MQNRTIKILKLTIGSFLSILVLVTMLYSMIDAILFQTYYHMEDIIITYALIIVICLFACIFLCSATTQKKHIHIIKRSTLTAIFIYYCFLLIFLLFLSRSYRYISPATKGLLERVRMNSNLIPFRTIRNYLFHQEHDELRVIITNLLGNLLAFMPMAFFLPIYIRQLKHLLPYTVFMIAMILSVEIIQAITSVGFFDIDDLILNMFGTIIAFLICKLKIVQKAVNVILK